MPRPARYSRSRRVTAPHIAAPPPESRTIPPARLRSRAAAWFQPRSHRLLWAAIALLTLLLAANLWNEQRPSAPRITQQDIDAAVAHALITQPMLLSDAAANAAGCEVYYWQIASVQHFDGFLVLPDYAARYRPLLPYIHTALDRVSAHLDTGAPLSDATFNTTPRGAGQPLTAQHLGISRDGN